jgi:hypothetical protein
VFTHWVSVPNPREPPPMLAQRAIAGRELPFLGLIFLPLSLRTMLK